MASNPNFLPVYMLGTNIATYAPTCPNLYTNRTNKNKNSTKSQPKKSLL